MVDEVGAADRSVDQRYVERLPHPALRDVISCVFVQGMSAGAQPYSYRSVPNGSVEISYLLGSVAPVVAGAQHEPDVQTLDPGSSVVGVRFRPGAANVVLGVPAAELTDRREELDRVWGRVGAALGDRLGDAASPEAAAALLEEEILVRATAAPEPDPVISELVKRLQPWRARRVTDQASELFLSPRQLRRRSHNALGYGPKELHRILRFQGFIALVDGADGHADLADSALTAGYADQAHLTRECVRMSDLTPRAFLAERVASCVGSHDHEASFLHVRRALRRASGA